MVFIEIQICAEKYQFECLFYIGIWTHFNLDSKTKIQMKIIFYIKHDLIAYTLVTMETTCSTHYTYM